MAALVFTRLVVDHILPPYRITVWLIDDLKFVLISSLDDLILDFFTEILICETRVLKLASTIILVLQANQLMKCASHPNSAKSIWK